jgi:hypothetical protein
LTTPSTVSCPHCLNDVPKGALVCRGCQAELTYGPPKMAEALSFLVPAFLAWLVVSFFEALIFDNSTILFIIFLAVFIPLLRKSRKFVNDKYKDSVYFNRHYKTQ